MPRLNIALRVPPRDLLTLSDCILECVTSDSNNAVDSLYATAYQLIRHDSNEHSTVYRASIGDRSVVLKCCLSDQYLSDLEREATAYQSALLELQGTVVPHFYGFYKGSLGNGRPMGCIVLEDCGDRPEFRILLYTDLFRRQICEKLGAMHLHGYHPDDFAERNVVHKDGNYRLIDFHQLSQHQCGWDGDWRLHQHMPRIWVFNCKLLRNWCQEMELWTIGDYITVFGEKLFNPSEYPKKEIIDQLLPNADEFVNIIPNRAAIIRWLARVKVRMDAGEGDIEYLKQSMPEFTFGRAWWAEGQRELMYQEIMGY